MAKWIKAFWAVFGTLAILVGLYLAFAAVGAAIGFWITAGLSALIASIWVLAKPTAEALKRIRTYPGLLEQVADENRARQEVERRLNEVEGQLKEEYAQGFHEGMRTVRGAVLAATGPSSLSLEGSAEDQDGQILLLARCSKGVAAEGAMYEVVSSQSSDVRGVAEVVEVSDVAEGKVVLRVIKATNAAFWDHVRKNHVVTQQVPPNTLLSPLPSPFRRKVDEPEAASAEKTVENEVGRND